MSGQRGLTQAERAAGLDAPLPTGETILWQEKPQPRALTRSIFHARGLATYFGTAALLVFALSVTEYPMGQAFGVTTLLLPFFGLAYGILALIGRATARATTYTLTNRRVILHIGIAYEMTVSVPLSAVLNASLRRRPDGSGEIALKVTDVNNVRYVALWPHARAWHFLKPQPMLRGLSHPDRVVEMIAEALIAFNASGRRAVPAERYAEAATVREAVAA